MDPLTLLSAIPDFLLAGSALLTWIDPSTLGPEKVRYFLLLMLLEFIVVHSAAFMGQAALSKAPRFGRAGSVLGLGAFYTLFVAGFAAGFHTWWPLWAFWLLTLNRLAGVLTARDQDPDADHAARIKAGWARGVLFYLLSAFATILLPLPRLGISADVVAAQHLTATGLWIEQPWRVVAMALVYFALQGWGTVRDGLSRSRPGD